MTTSAPTPTASSGSLAVVVDQPDGSGHAGVEPSHDIELQVCDGVVYLLVDGDEHVLTPGARASIPAGTPYRWWNAGDERSHVLVESRPA
jgi:quercetin dioxygenase-like cupin family protein